MGKCINQMPDGTVLPSKGKADRLLKIPGAQEIPGGLVNESSRWQEDIVCVVDNGPFETAAYAFSPEELKVLTTPDRRIKRWLIIPNAKELAK